MLKDVTADKVELNGIFKEARVKRGRNWQSGNEDTEVHILFFSLRFHYSQV